MNVDKRMLQCWDNHTAGNYTLLGTRLGPSANGHAASAELLAAFLFSEAPPLVAREWKQL